MELHQIKSFVTVARTGNLTRAAEQLHTTPPSVSAHIRQLEDQFGLQLFFRASRGMTLTPAGEALVHKAQDLLDAAQGLSRTARGLQGQIAGHLRLGINADPGFLRIEPLVHLLFVRHPGLSLEVVPSSTPEIHKRLASGEMDMGFVFGDTHPQGLALTHLSRVDLEIVVPKAFEDDCRAAGWKEIAALPWIRPLSLCPLLDQVSRALSQRNLELARPVTANDDITKAAMIRKGIAATVLERSEAVRLETDETVFIWKGHDGLSTPLYLAGRKASQDQPELAALARAVREVWQDETGSALFGGENDDKGFGHPADAPQGVGNAGVKV